MMPENQSSLQQAMNKILGTTASVSNTPVAATSVTTPALTASTPTAAQSDLRSGQQKYNDYLQRMSRELKPVPYLSLKPYNEGQVFAHLQQGDTTYDFRAPYMGINKQGYRVYY
jgi:hypothetical protein